MSYVVKPVPDDGKQEVHIILSGGIVNMTIKGMSRQATATVLFNALQSLLDGNDLTQDVQNILSEIGGKK